jgi:hypothetical protein
MFCHLELFWVSAAQWSLPGHVLIILNGQERSFEWFPEPQHSSPIYELNKIMEHLILI